MIVFPHFGAAKVYDHKTTKASPDFVEDHLGKKFAPVKIERILTDSVEQNIPLGMKERYQIMNLRRPVRGLG